MKATSSLLKLLAAVVAAVITTSSCSLQITVLPDGRTVAYSNGPCGRMPIFRQMPQGCNLGSRQGCQMVFRQGRPLGYWNGPSSIPYGGGRMVFPVVPMERQPPTMGTDANPILIRGGGRVSAFSMSNPSGFIP